MPMWSKLSLPDANSPQMELIINFHDYILMILTLIMILILYTIMSSFYNKFFNKSLSEAQELETLWTCIPAILLVLIAFPSLMTLYSMEETPNSLLTTKITGHQWYWSYSLPGTMMKMDSFMKNSFTPSTYRLLDTTQRLILPTNITTRFLITSMDVIHSWTLPTLGSKMDAVPGRINQVSITPLYSGLFFGQCSEICGINHSFMPITLEIIPPKPFIIWMKKI